jgi:hypothetical protein
LRIAEDLSFILIAGKKAELILLYYRQPSLLIDMLNYWGGKISTTSRSLT